MKQLLFLLLFPCFALAQYQGNGNQKITLGEQTSADGLVWRGRLADTANLLTNKLDTSVYIVLDTGTRAMWYYRASTTPKWTRLVDSLNNLQGQLSLTTKVTGVLPVANGGTGQTTLSAAGIVTGSGTTNYLPKFTGTGTIGNSTLINDASGNLGLGVAPSAWGSNLRAYQFQNGGSIASNQFMQISFNNNSYSVPGVNDYYISNGFASRYIQYLGEHVWTSAPSGNANDPITFSTRMTLSQSGNLGINITEPTEKLHVVGNARVTGNIAAGLTSATARIHLAAGTATASTAPLKFTSGVNLTTAEAGTMEFNGTNLFFSPSTTRHTVNHGLTGSATLDFPSTTTLLSADLTITVTGAADGDVVSLGVPNAAVNANTSYSAWVSAANTVTVRFNNYSSGTVNPASGTFKVFVTK